MAHTQQSSLVVLFAFTVATTSQGVTLRSSRSGDIDPLGIVAALRGNLSARVLWTPAAPDEEVEAPHSVQMSRVGKAPPPMRIERLRSMEHEMSLAKLMKGGTSMEVVLRTKLLDSPIFKTKISWECRKAKVKSTRNDCEWRKATKLFCQLMPQAAPKLSQLTKLEEVSNKLLSRMDTTETSAMLAGLQLEAEVSAYGTKDDSMAEVNAGVKKAIGDENLQDMYNRVTTSEEFKLKIRETCRGLEVVRPDCMEEAVGGVFCSTMTQAALTLVDADDLAAMMAGKMEMHFDSISVA